MWAKMLAMYLAVLDDRSSEEQFIDVYNTYKRLVYHTAYKIMGDSYLAEDVLQEVFLYVTKNFSKIHRENCHELAAYLVSCSRSRGHLQSRQYKPLVGICVLRFCSSCTCVLVVCQFGD